MKQKLKIRDFYIDDVNRCLEGKVESSKFNLLGSKIIILNHPEIEGFVFELFEVIDVNHVKERAKGIEFNIGDIYLKILIDKGWDTFNKLIIEDFYLEESTKEINEQSFEEIKKNNAKSILFEFKNMSNLFFANFYIDLRGGETGGVGRNEHGEPHFHIISRKENRDIGKVFFPTIEDYKTNNSQLIFSSNINRKIKKQITEWVFKDDLKNLEELNKTWVEQNRHNNRVSKQ